MLRKFLINVNPQAKPDDFYSNVQKMSPTEIEKVAEANDWIKVSKEGRTIYQDKISKNKFAVDTQHATFEVTDKTGKTSKGEVRFDGTLNKKEGHTTD